MFGSTIIFPANSVLLENSSSLRRATFWSMMNMHECMVSSLREPTLEHATQADVHAKRLKGLDLGPDCAMVLPDDAYRASDWRLRECDERAFLQHNVLYLAMWVRRLECVQHSFLCGHAQKASQI